MRPTEKYLQARLEACRKLYFQYNGREHARIEREMRANGFPDFNRRCLYARGINSGWIERHRWDRELLWKRPAASMSEPGAIATGSNAATRNEQERTKESSRKDAKPQRNAKNSKNSPNSQNSTNSSSTFHAWIKRVSPPMFDWDARHLKILIKALQLVTEGKIKRLMIFMPPRHGKSELVTTRYTAWRLMKNPALKVILASYAQSLANRFSRNIRNTLAEHFALERVDRVDRVAELQRKKPVSTGSGSGSDRGFSSDNSEDSDNSADFLSNPFRSRIINSAAEWETGKGGGVKAVGVGGGITGYGAGLMMIDDPIKSREQAESQSYRDKVWQWFNDDMLTRLDPDAPCILIQTRWHEDDLAGRILKQQQEDGTNDWHVISLPAIFEEPAHMSEPGAIATGSKATPTNQQEKTKESSRKDAKPQSTESEPGAVATGSNEATKNDQEDEAFLIRQLEALNAQLNKPPIWIWRDGRKEIVHPIGGLKPQYIRERILELEADLHRLRQRTKAAQEDSRKDAETQRDPKNSANSMNSTNSMNSPDFKTGESPAKPSGPSGSMLRHSKKLENGWAHTHSPHSTNRNPSRPKEACSTVRGSQRISSRSHRQISIGNAVTISHSQQILIPTILRH